MGSDWKRCKRCGDTGWITVFSRDDSFDVECDRCTAWMDPPASNRVAKSQPAPAAQRAVKEGTR